MNSIRLITVSIVVIHYLIISPALADKPGEVPIDGVLRDTPLYGLFGDYRQLSELRGKPLIINVWASWCPPCRAEMGSLERLSHRYAGKQFNMIGISIDDDANAASAFLLQAGITFDNYLDHKLTLENMLGANTIPLTVLVDAKGRILKKFHGGRQWDSPESIKMIADTLDVKL